jgi:hypothetical protein
VSGQRRSQIDRPEGGDVEDARGRPRGRCLGAGAGGVAEARNGDAAHGEAHVDVRFHQRRRHGGLARHQVTGRRGPAERGRAVAEAASHEREGEAADDDLTRSIGCDQVVDGRDRFTGGRRDRDGRCIRTSTRDRPLARGGRIAERWMLVPHTIRGRRGRS